MLPLWKQLSMLVVRPSCWTDLTLLPLVLWRAVASLEVVLVMELLVVRRVVIRVVVVNPHQWYRHRAHGFDGILGRLRVCIFCCSLVQGIQEEQAKSDTVWLFSLSSLGFVRSDRSTD